MEPIIYNAYYYTDCDCPTHSRPGLEPGARVIEHRYSCPILIRTEKEEFHDKTNESIEKLTSRIDDIESKIKSLDDAINKLSDVVNMITAYKDLFTSKS